MTSYDPIRINEEEGIVRTLFEDTKNMTLREKLNFFGGIAMGPIATFGALYFSGGNPKTYEEAIAKGIGALTATIITSPFTLSLGAVAGTLSANHLKANEKYRLSRIEEKQ